MTTWLKDDKELWKSIVGFEGFYAVSNTGRVRSLSRPNINCLGITRYLSGKMLRLSCDGEGYLQVGLLRNGREIKARVHRLVAEAFLPNQHSHPLIDHIDRNRKNNNVSNLRWASFSENRRNTNYRRRCMAELEAAGR